MKALLEHARVMGVSGKLFRRLASPNSSFSKTKTYTSGFKMFLLCCQKKGLSSKYDSSVEFVFHAKMGL